MAEADSGPRGAGARLASFLNTRAGTWLFLGLCAALYVLRVPDAYLSPQFFMEDATVFFYEQHVRGAEVLLQPYAGYLLWGQRLIALVVTALPLLWAPMAYALAALGFYLLVARLILDRRVLLPYRHLLALAIVLVPHSGEVYGNITNLQWIAPFGLLAILSTATAPATRAGRVGELAFTGILSFTGPFMVFLVPFFLLKAALVCRPRRFVLFGSFPEYRQVGHQAALAAIALVGACVQAALIVATRPVRATSADVEVSYNYAELVIYRVVTSVFARQDFATDLPLYVTASVAAVLAALTWASLRRPGLRFQTLSILGLSAVVLATVYLAFANNLAIQASTANGDRYFFIPKVCLYWLVITSPVVPRLLMPLLFAPILFHPVSKPAEPDRNWAFYAAQIGAGQTVTVPFNAGNGVVWSMTFRGTVTAPGSFPAGWNEEGYLAANPDVAEAVAEGKLPSGYHHYQEHGQREGRRGGF